jgi:hypothetical protein
MARVSKLEYLNRLPKTIPAGRWLVHNQVRPSRIGGTRGSRMWLATDPELLAPCNCGWAPELGQHYRVS